MTAEEALAQSLVNKDNSYPYREISIGIGLGSMAVHLYEALTGVQRTTLIEEGYQIIDRTPEWETKACHVISWGHAHPVVSEASIKQHRIASLIKFKERTIERLRTERDPKHIARLTRHYLDLCKDYALAISSSD